MIKLLENLDLLKQFLTLSELEVLLLCNFDCSNFSGESMVALSGGREPSITYGLSHFVLLFELEVVRKIEFFGGELHLLSHWGIEVASFSQEHLEILAGERDKLLLLGLSADYLLHKVLKDAWEFVWHFNLLSGKDSHVFDV
jgi:hypothetical protein